MKINKIKLLSLIFLGAWAFLSPAEAWAAEVGTKVTNEEKKIISERAKKAEIEAEKQRKLLKEAKDAILDRECKCNMDVYNRTFLSASIFSLEGKEKTKERMRDNIRAYRSRSNEMLLKVKEVGDYTYVAENETGQPTCLEWGFGDTNTLLDDINIIAWGSAQLFNRESAKAYAEMQLKCADEIEPLVEDYLDAMYLVDALEKEAENLRAALGEGDLYWTCSITADPCPADKKMFFIRNAAGQAESVNGVTRGCTPLVVKVAESKNCIFCPLFNIIFKAVQEMSTLSFSKLASSIAIVLMIGMALWIAFKTLGYVSSLTKQEGAKYITELLVQAFKVLVAFLLLSNASYIYGYIIGPVLSTGLEFGSALLFESQGINETNNLMTCGAKDVELGMGGVYPNSLYTKLHCFVLSVQEELAVPQAIGSTLMCVARHEGKVDAMGFTQAIWDFGMMLEGFIIWAFAWLIALAFAFYLIDATVRLGILGALMPFLIACWPFKATSGYTKTGWTMFLNTFFTYVFMGMVVSINVQLMGQSLGGIDELTETLMGNDVKKLAEILDIGFGGFLILICCCLFGFKLTAQATELATTMAGGGGGSNIGSKIGGLGVNVADRLARGSKDKNGNRTGGALGAAKWMAKPATNAAGKFAREKTAKAAAGIGSATGIGRYGGKAGSATAGAGGGAGGEGSGNGGGNGGGNSGNEGGNNNQNNNNQQQANNLQDASNNPNPRNNNQNNGGNDDLHHSVKGKTSQDMENRGYSYATDGNGNLDNNKTSADGQRINQVDESKLSDADKQMYNNLGKNNDAFLTQKIKEESDFMKARERQNNP